MARFNPVPRVGFNPAPRDKYAESGPPPHPLDENDDLVEGLIDTFPASDPVSAAQPAHAADRTKAAAGAADAAPKSGWGS